MHHQKCRVPESLTQVLCKRCEPWTVKEKATARAEVRLTVMGPTPGFFVSADPKGLREANVGQLRVEGGTGKFARGSGGDWQSREHRRG
jgi:hypothetical protein